jgi:hypothetical protein
MEHSSKALWRALRRVARPEEPLDLLRAVWPVMVGPRLAAHTRPVSWHRGRVDIAVGDENWRRELAWLTDEIRSQINRWWGTSLVREVRLVKARRGDVPPAPAADKSAGERRGAGGAETETAEAESRLSSALKSLEPALQGIRDEELRDLIARVATRYLRKQEKS